MGTPAAGAANLADVVRNAAEQFPDRIAALGEFGNRTWAQVDGAADAAGAALLAAGGQPGDRVLISVPSSPELIVTLIGAVRVGLVAVPIDPAGGRAAWVADRVQARIAVGDDELPVEISVPSSALAGWWQGGAERVETVGGGEDVAVLARASRSDRAVMIPHRAVLAAVAAQGSAPGFSVRADDRALMALPVFHLAGLVTGFLPLAAVGAAAVFPGPMDVLAAVREYKATVLPGSPAVYRQVLGSEGAERALASVRLMTSSASSLMAEDFSALRSLTGQSVWEGYGISEATSTVTSTLMTAKARPGSVGRPLPGVQLRIDGADEVDDSGALDSDDTAVDDSAVDDTAVDDTAVDDSSVDDTGVDDTGVDDSAVDEAADVPEPPPADSESTDSEPADSEPTDSESDPTAEPSMVEAADGNLVALDSIGEVGRVCVKGPTLFLGYWPDAADGPDEDGWYITADLGYLDDAGELHLVDRAVDTFTVRGFTVYPREIERVLADHSYVADAAVVGVPGPSGVTTVVAVLVPRPGTRPTPDDLTAFVADRLAIFKQPTVFHLVDTLPHTELGRVDRAAVLASVRELDLGELGLDEPPVDIAPEAVADLDQLGKRLPRDSSPSDRSSADSDDDLFGEDYT